MGMEKDTTLQLRVSSETLGQAREVFEHSGMSISQAVREFLEEAVAQGKMPLRHALSESEQAYKGMVRREERAIDNICGTTFVSKKQKGESREETFLRCIFGDGVASELSDDELRRWGASVGLPETLTLTALSELYDCGIFPKDICYADDEYRVKTKNGDYGAENIRQQMELVKLRLLAGALSAYYAESEEEAGLDIEEE